MHSIRTIDVLFTSFLCYATLWPLSRRWFHLTFMKVPACILISRNRLILWVSVDGAVP